MESVGFFAAWADRLLCVETQGCYDLWTPSEKRVSFSYVFGVLPKTGSLILFGCGQYADLLSVENVAQ